MGGWSKAVHPGPENQEEENQEEENKEKENQEEENQDVPPPITSLKKTKKNQIVYTTMLAFTASKGYLMLTRSPTSGGQDSSPFTLR